MSAYQSDTDPTLKTYARVRSGALARIEVCPASYAESLDQLDPSGEPAGFGSAYHDAMAEAASVGRAQVDVRAHAIRHGADPTDLLRLWARADYDPHGGEAELPTEIIDHEGKLVIRGRLDIVDADPNEPGTYDLTDYKTTRRIDEDPEPWEDPQTQSYTVGFFEARPEAQKVRTWKFYARRGSNGWSACYEITRDAMPAVRENLLRIARTAVAQAALPLEKRRFQMSHHCDYCPGRVTCPAIRHETTSLLSALELAPRIKADGQKGKRTDTVLSIEIDYDNVVRLHELRKLLEKGAKELSEHIKQFVAAFGPMEVEPGKFLAVLPASKRVSFNEATLRRGGAALGLGDAVQRLLDWRDAQPKVEEERLDIYKAERLLEASEE